MKKKIIITVIVLLVLAGAAGGGVYAYKSYHDKGLVAEVVPVSNINWGYWGDEMQSYGMVTNDLSQDIYLDMSQQVAEVYVEEGQQVAIGDKLMQYDITTMEISLEMKGLEIQNIENEITLAQKELTELKNMTPIAEKPQEPEQTEPEVPEVPETPEKPVKEKTKNAYNYISKTAKPYTGDGSEEKPFHFLCNKDAYVKGSYLNYLKEKSFVAIFEIREGNSKKGTLISSWMVNGAAMNEVDADSQWSVLNRAEIEEPEVDDDVPEVPDVEDDGYEEPEGYTAAELAKKIREKEAELRDLDLDKRSADLDYQSYQKECESGIAYAKINGTIKKVSDPENPPNDGTPFLSVSGSDGLYVKGTLSEMVLDKVKVGQLVTAMSWDSGMSFEATITEISDYPEASGYSGEGNPNSSYYSYTAYIQDSTGLNNGEYVQLTMNVDDNVSTGEAICIDRSYIREESGRYYVLKADEDGSLVKQYVTGRTVYGSGMLIKSGLSSSDRIAFPYGKTAKEGVKILDVDNISW